VKTIILAGGKGTRLKPLTNNLPKPMVPINGKPLIWYILKQLEYYNVQSVNLAVGFKSEIIKQYFNNHLMNINVNIVDNGDVDIIERIKFIANQDRSDDLLILYGDTISDVNIKELFLFSNKHPNHSVLTVWPLKTNFGVVEIDKNNLINEFKEKPKLDKFINVGYFVLRKEMFNILEEYDSYAEFLIYCGSKKLLKAYKHDGEHFTINNLAELEEVKKNLNKIKIFKNEILEK